MSTLAVLAGNRLSPTNTVAIALFIGLLTVYLGYLVWANTRPSDPDLAAALDFERRQAATAKAIAGEDK